MTTESKPKALSFPVALVISFCTIAASLGGTWATGQWRDNSAEKRLDAVEAQMHSDHDLIREMATDLKWIKQKLGGAP